MGTIRKRKRKIENVYYAEVRQKNSKSIGKTFLKRSNATRWVKEVEYQLERQSYVDFRNTVVILTSNIGASLIKGGQSFGFGKKLESLF